MYILLKIPFENAGNQRLYTFYIQIKMFYLFRLPKHDNTCNNNTGTQERNL